MFLFVKKLVFGLVVGTQLNFSLILPINKKFDPMNLDDKHRVAKSITPISQERILNILCSSHKMKHGRLPSANRLALSWAQVALENNRGKKVWNNNLGNQGPFRMDQEYYHHLRGGWPYRSFKTLEESGISYWSVLEKCSRALRAFDDGDVDEAVKSLKRCNYFSSDTAQYTLSIRSLYYEAKSKFNISKFCG